LYYNLIVNEEDLIAWRKRHRMTRKELARLLGVHLMAVAYWEWGKRRIPPLLPLALEALENRIQKGGKDEINNAAKGKGQRQALLGF
jgi:DNA-binding XRE family transcriptional regulator